nr:hypothetical protein [Tanacetum cinerariifolium]
MFEEPDGQDAIWRNQKSVHGLALVKRWKLLTSYGVHKAAKRRKLSEEAQEAEDLRKRLEIVQDEDDDVFVEATPLTQKVPVMDYQIVVIDNKPRFTLEQLVNMARLQVEEESEMSLELLRFTRQQFQEYQQG